MHTLRIVGILALTAAMACGGGKQSAPGPSAGASGGGAAVAGAEDSGEPAWVSRGSAAVTSGKRRVFYGVGAAGGIKNPALLRGTADNRARAELARVFEVFSASLMKDYMSSSGTQEVQQAVKTFSSMSLEGSEVVDRYIAGDGTMYALAALDLQKVMDGVRRAKELGAVKSHTKKVSVDDIFDQHAKPTPEPPRLVAEGQSGAAAEQGGADASGAKERSGGRPAWVDGTDPSYPLRTYLCAVGYGPARGIAENGSYAALSRIFEARVASVSKDFMGAYSTTGAQSVETQSIETLTKVSTAKIFTGVRIVEVWQGGGSAYAYACIDRNQAGQTLRDEISKADEEAGRYLQQATKIDNTSRVQKLGQALDAIVHREALNGELRIVDPDGIGLPGSYSHVDVATAFEAAVEALKVGVRADGPHADELRGALVEGLTSRGYKVTDLNGDDESAYDVLVNASITVEDGGKGSGGARSMHFARGVIQVEVKNVATSKILASFNESRKEGSRSLNEAERLAIRKLSKKLTNKVGAKIDATMKGR